MLRRLAPLLLLAACSRAPDQSTCRLVGTWEMEQQLDEELKAKIKAEGGSPTLVLARAKAFIASQGVGVTETFHADGKWTSFVDEGGDPVHAAATWVLVADDASRVVICIRDPRGVVADWSRSFEFVSADRMREIDGDSYTRVVRSK